MQIEQVSDVNTSAQERERKRARQPSDQNQQRYIDGNANGMNANSCAQTARY